MRDSLKSPEICLDSNVIVPFLAPDEHTDETETLFRNLGEKHYTIYAPSMVQFEVVNALGRKESLKLIDAEIVDLSVDRFFNLPIVVVWNQSLLEGALKLRRNGLKSLYDASFLALAIDRGIALVTEDQEILKKGRKLYPRVHTVREWLKLHA